MKTLQDIEKILGRKPTKKEMVMFEMMKDQPNGEWRKDSRGKLWWHKAEATPQCKVSKIR